MGKAVISQCGRYRYVLRRSLTNILDVDPNATEAVYKPMLFIMLNPSTADAENDDPTIRRCISFAKREGASHLSVVNLFAYRATDPAELKRAADPIGPENDRYINEEVGKSWMTVAAWGAHPLARERAEAVMRQIHGYEGYAWCLGQTKSGAPKHPLYIADKQPFVVWKARSGDSKDG